MATIPGSQRLLNISGNNIATAVSLEAGGTLLDGGGLSGSSNQVLISTGTGVDWVNSSSIIGGPYLPLSGGGMTGTLVIGSQQLKFSDAGRLFMGDSNDLQIYHDGSDSYIDDTGAGWLRLRGNGGVILSSYSEGETMLQATRNGAVDLYYDNSKKFETTSAGVTVTGNVTAVDGTLTGSLTIGDTTGANINMLRTSANYINATNATGYLVFRTGGYNTALTLSTTGNGTFGDQAFATTATSSGDASSTLTTKGYVDSLITASASYR